MPEFSWSDYGTPRKASLLTIVGVSFLHPVMGKIVLTSVYATVK
jgi:hypothetical protein